MTTFYDMDSLERLNAHLEGEVKDAKRLFQEYRKLHDGFAQGRGQKECRCHLCLSANAWLARNKKA